MGRTEGPSPRSSVTIVVQLAPYEAQTLHEVCELGGILRLGGITFGVVYAGLLVVFWAVWPWLPIVPGATGIARFALALMLATVMSSCSPTMTIAVITDTRSCGPLSELTLALVVLADLALILIFTLAMQFVHWSLGTAVATEVGLVPRVAWEIVGSLAFGAAVGAAFALYLRYVGREITLVLLGLCVVLSEIGPRLHFEPLLAALAAGLVVENVAEAGGEALKEAVERGARPVLVVFFAAAGASLHLDALAVIGITALLISGVRLSFIRFGTALGVPRSGIDPDVGRFVWMGLISKAGVTLGLVVILATEFPTWGTRVETLMVAVIALHELVGPVLFKWALARRGEIGQMEAATTPAAAEAPV